MEAMLKYLKLALFCILLAVFLISFFYKDDFHRRTEIVPDALNDPVQTDLKDKTPVTFERDGYSYKVTPLYDYDISGMLVHKNDYRFFSLDKVDNAIPFDFCMIWGQNLATGTYEDSSLKFSQDSRFCNATWGPGVGLKISDVSNNHLIINDDNVAKEAKNVSVGDQVRIKGELVNLQAVRNDQQETETWHTSVTRDDTGAGACEVILVKDIEILGKSDSSMRILNKIAFWGLILFIPVNIIWFFINVSRKRKQIEKDDLLPY